MSQINYTFEYNGQSYEFDVRDAENSEKLEDAIDQLRETEKKLPKTGRLSVIYKANCQMIRDFFDTIFGEGAGVKICGERHHVTAHYDAYKAFIDFANPQRDDVMSYSNTFAKYSNRKQRRAAAKAKK